jgi:hypothetical protein
MACRFGSMKSMIGAITQNWYGMRHSGPLASSLTPNRPPPRTPLRRRLDHRGVLRGGLPTARQQGQKKWSRQPTPPRLRRVFVLQWRMPLALDDPALARVMIAATAIAPAAREAPYG